MDTLNKLLNEYPNVEINKIGDYYTRDKKIQEKLKQNNIEFEVSLKGTILKPKHTPIEVEYEKLDHWGYYDDEKKCIYINHVIGRRYKNLHSYFTDRHLRFELIKKLEEYGLDTKSRLFKTLASSLIELIVIHEFGHALEYQYGIDVNTEIINLYDCLSPEERSYQLSEYSNKNIHEFIAEGFIESRFINSRPLGKKNWSDS